MRVLYTVELCQCCLLKLANDDTSGCEFSLCHAGDVPAPMAALELETGESVVPGDSESDETEFSRVPCDGCGSQLAGFRHTASVLGSE